jgi:pyruvate dehydrogenase complex dehydrogenase (E1) component
VCCPKARRRFRTSRNLTQQSSSQRFDPVHYHSEELVRDVSAKAQAFRIQVLKMVYHAQSGHIGGAFSAAEVVASLYFHHLRVDPANPARPDRDRFLFSKGHACALLYTTLAHRGFFPVEELMTFRQFNSRLQGHPDKLKTPGVEICAGPLGTVSRSARAWRWRRRCAAAGSHRSVRRRPEHRPGGCRSCWAMVKSTPV